MFKSQSFVLLLVSIIALPLSLLFSADARAVLDPSTEADYNLKLLGKYVFFDKISEPQRMACVTCHEPTTGGTGGVSGVNLHQVAITGANPHTVGNLKPPTNAYASFIPQFHPCEDGGLPAFPPAARQNYCGGNFWSGRTEGYIHPEDVGNPHSNVQFPPASVQPGINTGIVDAFNSSQGGGPIKTLPQPQPGIDRDPNHVATKHIGYEVFQGLDPSYKRYYVYFGPTADQALNPMPNVVEQNKQRLDVCLQVQASKYAPLYKAAWGVAINCSDTPVYTPSDVDNAPEKEYDLSFKRIILAICAWQHSKDLNSFSSKRDIALQRELDGVDVDDSPGKFPLKGLTCQENYGHDLFYSGPNFGPPRATVPADRNGDCEQDVDAQGNPVFAFPAGCAFCHSNLGPVPQPFNDGTLPEELYTHQDYHNIGVPFNPEIPVLYTENTADTTKQPPPDEGLKSHLVADYFGPIPPGFFKTPTLRNVDKRKGNGFTKAYTHNGWFKSLESIVHFYNTADVDGATAASFGVTRCIQNPLVTGIKESEALKKNCWPAPQFPDSPSAIPFLLGDLHLTKADEAAIVAYLKTLTDTETATAPTPYKSTTSTTSSKKKK
jgi:cytochrome c peroxidase